MIHGFFESMGIATWLGGTALCMITFHNKDDDGFVWLITMLGCCFWFVPALVLIIGLVIGHFLNWGFKEDGRK